MRKTAALALVAAGMLASDDANAQALPPAGGGVAVVAVAAGVTGGLVTGIGSQVKVIEGEPSREWGTASYALSVFNGVGAAVTLIVSAFVDEDDRAPLLIVGGIWSGIAITGIVGGAVTDAALPPDDDGIDGVPRPPDAVSAGFMTPPVGAPMLQWTGRF